MQTDKKFKHYYKTKSKTNQGFTLAEVLVTLAIIGVVAALTIPSLIQKTQKQQYVTQLKKTYAVLSQAIQIYESQNDCEGNLSFCPAFAGHGGAPDDAFALNSFAPYLNIIKNCGAAAGCVYAGMKTLHGDIYVATADFDNYYNGNQLGKGILADGSIIIIDDLNDNADPVCSRDYGDNALDNAVCATIRIDVNGKKLPNQVGRDVFTFWVTKTGIYPMGINNDNRNCANNAGQDESYSQGCTAKVLREGAMNY